MVGITNKLEYLKELEKAVLKALQAITDCNDLVGFGIDNGLDCGYGSDIDNQDYLTDSLEQIKLAIKLEESEQSDPEFEADRLDYIQTVTDAYNSAKAGSK